MTRPHLRLIPRTDAQRLLVRLTLALLSLTSTGIAATVFARVLLADGLTLLDIPLHLLFCVLFIWVSLSFWSATLGFMQIMRNDPHSLFPIREEPHVDVPHVLLPRTAILMPIYNEDPTRVFAGIQAMHTSLEQIRAEGIFDIFILSDTTNPEVWAREERAFARLKDSLGRSARLYYRRRRVNHRRKSGNIEDFCRRWAGQYEYMVVLDADSVMSGQTLVEMVQRMERDPKLGILQAPPVPVNRNSVWARCQQFAASVYGEVFTTGFAVWTASSGNYFGHNAIIRVGPFCEHCGLPNLPGKRPLGGEILSHDFVEAALMRKAGYKVRIAYDLGGSYEECPTTLIDFAQRDYRWCQGNLQHLRLVFAYGLHPMSRLHLGMGIMSYVSSPLWLLFMVLGLLEVGRATLLAEPDAAEPQPLHTLVPLWAQMVMVFSATMLMLFLPRVFSLFILERDQEQLEAHGGEARVAQSILLELAISVFVAPILMAFHATFVCVTLLGRTVGWSNQQREDAGVTWRGVWRAHRWHTLAGLVATGVTWLISPAMVVWLSPVLAGLVLAAPVSKAVSSPRLGDWLRRRGLLCIPEELNPPPVLQNHNQFVELNRELETHEAEINPLDQLVADPAMSAAHAVTLELSDQAHALEPGRAALLRERWAGEGPQSLTADEIKEALCDPNLVREMHERAWLSWPLERLRAAGVR